MGRTALWTAISDRLTAEIADGHFAPGDKLPTEAALAARFDVNRHTVRRALAAMAEAGLVHSRRGAGVFVTTAPTEYPIGRRVRFHQNLAAAGQLGTKRMLRLATRSADQSEAGALGLVPGDKVYVYEGISLADAVPIATFQSVFPGRLPATLLSDLAETGSVTEALRRAGVADFTRVSTRLAATRASATQARHLRVPEGAPVLRTVSINVDAAERPVEFGRAWFAGDRVSLTVAPE